MSSANILLHITEHHSSVIAGYKLWIGKEADLRLIGTSHHPKSTINQGKDMVDQPDVLILDYSFGEETIVSFIGELRNTFPEARLMVATGYDLPNILRSLFSAGIDGVITKDEGANAFIQCVRTVASGGIYQSRWVREYLQQENKILDLYNSLTPAEMRVLRKLTTGMPDADICTSLKIAPSTLDNHRTNLFMKIRKFGYAVHSKSELVMWHNKFCGSNN